MTTLRKKIAFFLFITVAVLFGPLFVHAHATPITYDPEASAILEKMPARIRINFTERIEGKASAMAVFAPDGFRIDDGLPTVNAEDPHVYGVGVRDAGEGTYAVSWQVVSADDGHFTKGAFVFSIGKETASGKPGTEQIQVAFHSSFGEGLATSLELMGLALAVGLLVLYSFLWRKLYGSAGLPQTEEGMRLARERFTKAWVAAAVLMFIGAICYLLLKGADLAAFQKSTFTSGLWAFLAIVSGKYALLRALVAVGLLSVFLSRRSSFFSLSRKISKREVVLYALLAVATYARVRASHGAASLVFPALTFVDHMIQITAKGFWAGALVALATVFLPVLRAAKDTKGMATALTWFSKSASIALAMVGVTGAYIVWLDLKDPANILTTDWGSRFITLSFFGGLLVAARFYNQLVLGRTLLGTGLPRILNERKDAILSSAGFSFLTETILGVALIFATGFILITTPPFTQKNLFERRAASGDAVMRLTEHPYETSQLLVALEDTKKTPLPAKDAVITLTNTDRGIGPIVANTEKRFEGGYVFAKNSLNPPGSWRIAIAAQRLGAYDFNGDFAVEFPRDIEEGRITPEHRRFGSFETLSILAALVTIGLAIFLYRDGRKQYAALASQSETVMSGLNADWMFFPSFFVILVLSMGLSIVQVGFLKSGFQKLCEENGDVWHQMVPTRNNKVVSQYPTPGCMVDNGKFHFGGEREYTYFRAQKK